MKAGVRISARRAGAPARAAPSIAADREAHPATLKTNLRRRTSKRYRSRIAISYSPAYALDPAKAITSARSVVRGR
jgi:hypothetical protein